MSVNKAILIGRLGKDPELKYTKAGTAVASFSLATTIKIGEEDKTTWHNIVAWDKTAEVVNEYLKKGSHVFIEGWINNRSYDDKDGNKRYTSEVVVVRLDFLDPKEDKNKEKPADRPNKDDDDDLPF